MNKHESSDIYSMICNENIPQIERINAIEHIDLQFPVVISDIKIVMTLIP